MAQTITPTPPSPLILSEPDTSPGPFEGPEKLLEVWFAPTPDALVGTGSANHGSPLSTAVNGNGNVVNNGHLSANHSSARRRAGVSSNGQPFQGLRTVPRAVWEEMLDIVKCKVLSVIEGDELDSYLLSESSLFVAPHVVILKTCGTTLNLLGLNRILEIAREYCGFTNVYRCFYSRKSFFFPERQQGPHRDWTEEVKFLDNVFGNSGSAYTVGPINRDNWLLYITGANPVALAPSGPERLLALPPPCSGAPDQTLEILMSHLTPAGSAPFFLPELPTGATPESRSGHELGADISAQLGIDTLFPKSETILDSFGFEPCGYSANAVVGSGLNCTHGDGGYFTIHVTPEDGWSYASFECNVPLPLRPNDPSGRPDMSSLIRRVVDIFQPNRLTITLFVSTGEDSPAAAAPATNAIGADLFDSAFTRKDRIVYEFEGYDLLFACFERRDWVQPRSPVTNNKITLLP
ncbi:hypothetical protein CspHIS471_0406520 [Cutaneotrichosporon sp. HIS471]|nr:hypothetical protein CspHIS471_0406520 [Cutaneotrichosporon sp. HIS471]